MSKSAMQELIEKLAMKSGSPLHFYHDYDEIIKEALEKEKEQIIDAWIATDNELQRLAAEEYYNQTYNQEPKKEYQPSEEYLKKQRELMEDFVWNKMNNNNQNK